MPELPWDCTVTGTPVSVNSRSSSAVWEWKLVVAAKARALWPADERPLLDMLQIHATYYYAGRRRPDVDNFIKPISDALEGIVYVNDRQLLDAHTHLRSLDEPFIVRGMTEQQATGFVDGLPFVHIRIEAASSSSRLP